MPELPHGFKNARQRFEALPRYRERIEFPASWETNRTRFRRSRETVHATPIPQGFRRGLSLGEIRQWMENRDRHNAPVQRGMERFRESAVGSAEREPRTVRQGPRRPEDATRPERRDSGRRIRNIMRRIPVLNSPVRNEPSSTRPYAATFSSEAGDGRSGRRNRPDTRNAPPSAEAASAPAAPPDSRERLGSAPAFRQRGWSKPVLPAEAQARRIRQKLRQAGRRVRPIYGDGRTH